MANLESFQHFSISSGSIPFSVVRMSHIASSIPQLFSSQRWVSSKIAGSISFSVIRMPHIGSSISQLFYSAVKGEFLQKFQFEL